jgi:hypothetical protein
VNKETIRLATRSNAIILASPIPGNQLMEAAMTLNYLEAQVQIEEMSKRIDAVFKDKDEVVIIIAALAEVLLDYVPAFKENAASFLLGLHEEYIEEGPRKVRRQ